MNLEQRLRRLEFVHRTARLTSWVWDIESDAVHWFGEPEALLGLPEGGFSGRFPDYLAQVHPEDVVRARATFVECLKGLRPHYRGEERVIRPDGSVRWVETFGEAEYGADGRAVRMAGVVRDITDRKAVEERLAHQLYHDDVTGLPNRALLMDRLAVGISQARRKGDALGLLVVDLDRFHDVTSGLGHEIADEVLRKVAQRLAGCVRGGDTLARISGSEFALVLSDLARPHDAGLVARKVLDAMAEPVVLADGSEVFLTSSVGIAMYPHDGSDGERLLQAADAAMVQARAHGPNHLQLYSEALGRRTAENLALQQDLRYALERGEFQLHYQPRADLASERITGFEALLRWHRPGRGMVDPADFIPLLEESGLIVAVGEWVIRQACVQLQEWLEAGVRVVPVAVNVSARQFLHADLAGTIERTLCRHSVPAPLLEVEITESDSMRNADEAVATLARLRAAGVGVAIDDFGTGYSSLAYLKRFRVDALKLDRSFVRGLPQDSGDVSIARAVIGMAHGLGLRTVAEGVETPAQRAFLAGCGCNEMQGFLLSRALPAEQAAAFLTQQPVRIGAHHVLSRVEDSGGDRRGEGHRRRHGEGSR